MTVEGARPGLRVVSLVPSVTETLVAWGIVPVGVTRFCEQPELFAVGGTKTPDLDVIAALGPDLVVVNDEENRREDAAELAARGIAVHSCSPRSVAEVAPALAALAAAVDAPASVLGVEVVEGRPRPHREPMRPLGVRAFVPIWRRPWMTISGDTYGSSLLASIGVENVFAEPNGVGADGDRYPTVTWDQVEVSRPDVVLAPTEPYDFKPFHLEVLREVAPVVAIDGQDLFWWGVRTPLAAERLREQILAGIGR